MRRRPGLRTCRTLAWLRNLVAGLGIVPAVLASNPAAADGAPLNSTRDLTFEEPGVGPSLDGSWTVLETRQGSIEVPVGAPAVPVFEAVFRVPRGHEVVDVRLESDVWEAIPLRAPIRPFAGPASTAGGEPEPAAPSPEFYRAVFPDPVVAVSGTALARDRTLVGVRVAAWRHDPVERELHWLKSGRIVLTTRPAAALPEALLRLRGETGADGSIPAGGHVAIAERGFAPSEIPSLAGSRVDMLIVTTESQRDVWQTLADWKTLTGTPAVVRTVEEALPLYPSGADRAERLRMYLQDAYAHWGVKYVILAGEAGPVPYRYAHSWSWNADGGGLEVLSDYYFACLDGTWNADGDGFYGEPIHGIENSLGDGADLGGSVDFGPDVLVGRIPTRTAGEAQNYLDKYFTYTRTPALDGYLNRILMIAEVLFEVGWVRGDCDTCNSCPEGTDPNPCVTQDGVEDAEFVAEIIETTHKDESEISRVYERDYIWGEVYPDVEGTNLDLIKSKINAGANIIHQVGHGDVDRWAVGSTTGGIELRFVGADAASLTNGQGGRFTGLTYAINCNSAAVDFDCLGEAIMGNGNGGTVIYIGATNLDFPASARQYQDLFYEGLYIDQRESAGEAYYATMEERATGLPDNIDTTRRFVLYSLIFMGDPQMQVWLKNPGALALDFAQEVSLGDDEVEITVTRQAGGLPLEGARVALSKGDETYAVGFTDASGAVTLPLLATSTGAFTVAASAYQFLPATENGQVVASGSALVSVANVDVKDDGTDGSVGNGNGLVELGETIAVALTVSNPGGSAAQDVEATLRWDAKTWEEVVGLDDSTVALGDIAAGGQVGPAQAFLVSLPRVVPGLEDHLAGGDQMNLDFRILLTFNGGERSYAWKTKAVQPLFTPFVNTVDDSQGDGDGVAENGEVIDLRVGLWNTGTGTASHLKGTLAALPTSAATLVNNAASAPDLEPGETGQLGPYRMTINQEEILAFRLFLEDTLVPEREDVVIERIFRLTSPAAPEDTSVVGIGQRSSIILTWANPGAGETGDGLLGARIFRSPDEDGPFDPIFDGLALGSVDGPTYYTDDGLAPLQRYYYQISLVDSSGNEGPRTGVVETTTSPGALSGWPIRMEADTRSSPTVTELDGHSGREIILGGEVVYALAGKGGEYRDGDGVASTFGVLTAPPDEETARLGRGRIWGKVATWDLDGSGDTPEIIATARDGDPADPQLGVLMVFDESGRETWRRTLGRFLIGSAVVGNIDGDAQSEVLIANSSRIHVFNHDGTSATSFNSGRLIQIAAAENQHQTVSVADVDGDGRDEAVLVTWNGNARNTSPELWVVNGEETNVPGFPIVLGSLGQGAVVGNTGAVSISDIDNDGTSQNPDLELVFLTAKRFWVFEHTGNLRYVSSTGFEFGNGGEGQQSPAIGDVDRDGVPDLVFAMKQIEGVLLHVIPGTNQTWDQSAELEGFPVVITQDSNLDPGSPILANVNGDVYPEILMGDANGRVHVYDKDGEIVSGFPYILAGADLRFGGLAVWDVDGDGGNNLIIQGAKSQEVVTLDLPNAPSGLEVSEEERDARNPWPMKYHDVRNSSFRPSQTLTPVLLSRLEALEVEPGVVRIEFATGFPAAEIVLLRRDPDALSFEERERIRPSSDAFQTHELIDRVTIAGLYEYRIDFVDVLGRVQEASRFQLDVGGSIRALVLEPNRPNPFRPRTLLSFQVPGAGPTEVQLWIYDPSGRVVRKLVSEPLGPGIYAREWDGRNEDGASVSTGLYMARLRARGEERIQKLILMK